MFILASTIGCFIAFFLIPIQSDTDARTIFLIIVLAFGLLIGVMTIITSIFSHIENLSRVRLGEVRVVDAARRTAQLKDNIKEIFGGKVLTDDILALANKDNPISKAIGSIDSAILNEEYEKNRLIRAKESIIARKTGPLSFVVSLYGEE